jgi:hypothetical protein
MVGAAPGLPGTILLWIAKSAGKTEKDVITPQRTGNRPDENSDAPRVDPDRVIAAEPALYQGKMMYLSGCGSAVVGSDRICASSFPVQPFGQEFDADAHLGRI